MSLTNLVRCCEAACTEMQPLVSALYGMMNASIRMEKPDKSVFTVADGLVQNLLVEHLLSGSGIAIVGEEDVPVTTDKKPYMVGDLAVPAEVEQTLEQTLAKLAGIRNQLFKSTEDYGTQKLTAFIDPIDGTREFASGKGEQCTICIGFAQAGRPVAGVVYRPLSSPPTWAAGAPSEQYGSQNLKFRETPVGAEEPRRLITTNGTISAFTKLALEQHKIERVTSGGCGNKSLMVLEGHADYYFQDRGVSRWDTCAAEAILEANGYTLVKMAPALLGEGVDTHYTYTLSDANTDFVPNQANLTAYNSANKEVKSGPAAAVSDVLPYSNLAGMIVVKKEALPELVAQLRVVAAQVPPSFD